MKIPRLVSKDKIKAAVSALKNIPWALGERVFPFFMAMIFLAVLTGAAFFFKVVILDQQQKLGAPNDLPIFQKQELNDIVAIWEARIERLRAAGPKDYPDIFSPQSK